MPAVRASPEPPTGGRQSRETPVWRATTCFLLSWLDALTAGNMGAMSALDAAPKPPESTAAHRRTLRATTPFKTPVLTVIVSPARQYRKRGFKGGGLATPVHRLSCDGVRGKPPTKTGAWAHLFARRGGKIFAAPPGLLSSLRANVRRWARPLKINRFCETAFSVRTPLPACLS